MHKEGVAHCDLKPGNVLLEIDANGKLNTVLSDFGIARILNPREIQVEAFEVANVDGVSISFAAPEAIARFRSRVAEIDTDIYKGGDVYSLSIIVYEMLKRDFAWR
jgi:serine/threonine protein kinase